MQLFGDRLFFGVGAGRCGSMLLANLLNSECDTLCVHEGKVRVGTQSQKQWLPFLTLENYRCYARPETARDVFFDRRKIMLEILDNHNYNFLGDIAYNYAPFTEVIPSVFEHAKLIVLTRDGRDFVRSVYTSDRPDPLPVGWLDENTELTDLEKFVALGRLRPLPGSNDEERWKNMSPVQKNAWLWSETYRKIFDGLKSWKAENYIVVRSEDFFSNTEAVYSKIRNFLGFSGVLTDETYTLLRTQVNRRASSGSYILPHYSRWPLKISKQFWGEATEMMQRLNYV